MWRVTILTVLLFAPFAAPAGAQGAEPGFEEGLRDGSAVAAERNGWVGPIVWPMLAGAGTGWSVGRYADSKSAALLGAVGAGTLAGLLGYALAGIGADAPEELVAGQGDYWDGFRRGYRSRTVELRRHQALIGGLVAAATSAAVALAVGDFDEGGVVCRNGVCTPAPRDLVTISIPIG